MVIPQGSILGPLLFLLFINDLVLYPAHANTDLFADDSTLHLSGKSLDSINNKLQIDLNNISVWCHQNNMHINISKTKCVTIGKRQRLSTSMDLILTQNGLDVSIVKNQKLLGIYFDQHSARMRISITYVQW